MAVVLGPLLAAAVAGSALAVAAPERSALGSQVAAGPPGAVVAVIALMLVPAVAGSIVVVPALVGALHRPRTFAPRWSRRRASRSRRQRSPRFPRGAVVAEGGIAAARKQHRRALAIGVAVLGWIAVGLSLGAAPLGPLGLVASALRGAGSPWLALGGVGWRRDRARGGLGGSRRDAVPSPAHVVQRRGAPAGDACRHRSPRQSCSREGAM